MGVGVDESREEHAVLQNRSRVHRVEGDLPVGDVDVPNLGAGKHHAPQVDPIRGRPLGSGSDAHGFRDRNK
jgi:hypothetical protein